jgi:chromosomal replication initiation ATPase DnaA
MTLHLMPTPADLAWQRRSRTPVREIAASVADKYGLTVDDLRGTDRTRRVAWPRQEAMAEIRRHRQDMSLPDIGRFFNRDHTTVIHALRAVAKRKAKGELR